MRQPPTSTTATTRQRLLRRGVALECLTLAWNVVGCVVVGIAAIAAGSVALAGFGLDSLIEIAASTVVIWQLRDRRQDHARERHALRLIGVAFLLLAIYIVAQAIYTLTAASHPHSSTLGIVWTAATAAVMLALATGKVQTGTALNNRVLSTEGRVTLIDATLAATVLLGLLLNTTLGWWQADPLAGLIIVFYAFREGRAALQDQP